MPPRQHDFFVERSTEHSKSVFFGMDKVDRFLFKLKFETEDSPPDSEAVGLPFF